MLSFLLALLMIASILPMAVFAEGNELTAELYGFTFTASGEIPEGASLQVTDPGAEVESRIQKDILGIPEVGDSLMGYAFDIKIVDAQGNEWQPEDLNVTISVSGFPVENASVDVYHILDDAEAIDNAVEENVAMTAEVDNADGAFDAELAAAEEAESVDADAVVYTKVSGVQNEGKEISFSTDSFSTYYIMTQSATRTIYFSTANGQHDDVYVRVGETFQVVSQRRGGIFGFNVKPCWAWDPSDGYPGAPAANVMVATLVPDGHPDRVYTLSTDWSGYWEGRISNHEAYHTSTCTIKVNGGAGQSYRLKCVEEVISKSTAAPLNAKADITIHIVNDIPVTGKKVSVGLFDADSAFASEPFKNELGLHYDRLLKDNLQVINKDTNPNIYSSNAADLIKTDIVRSANFVQNANNAAVWGVVSGTGAETRAFLNWTDSDCNTIIQNFINYEKSIGNNKYDKPAEDYRLIPYVIKFQAGTGNNQGKNGQSPADGEWFVDCIIIPKDKFTISYDANIEYGYFATSGTLPNGAIVNDGDEYTVGSTNLKLEKTTETTVYSATFVCWEDQYGNRYNPGDKINSVHKDYTLRAIWSYGDQVNGALRFTKQVTTAEGSLAPDANQSFTIRTTFSSAVNTAYVLYDKDMKQIGSGTVNGNYVDVSVKADETVVISNIPQNTTYTISEAAIPVGYTLDAAASTGLSGTISAGHTSRAIVVNNYSNCPFTIKHIQNGAVVEAKTETLYVEDYLSGLDITAKTSKGYLYGGTFTGADMKTVAINGNPKNFVPKAGATYYIKEVLPYYLQPQYFCVYDNYRDDKIVNVYLITGMDDNNYKEVGFNASRSIADPASSHTAYNFFTVKNFEYVVNKPETDVKNPDNHITGQFTGTGSKDFAFGDIFGLSGKDGVLYVAKTGEDYGFTNINYTAYYVTQDNVKVTGNYARDIKVGADGTHSSMVATLSYVGATTEYKAPTPKQAPRLTMMSSYTANSYKSNDVALFGITKVDDGKNGSQIVPQGDNSGMIEYTGKDGFYFAGWFTDETYAEACDFSNVNSEMTAYAKYIPQSDISISASKSGLSLKNFTLKSTVDVNGNKFKEVGVVYNVNGTETMVAASQTENKFNAFLNFFGANKSTVEYTADLAVKGMASNTNITVTPYWVTMDGTVVYGNPVSYTYRLGLIVKN